MTAYIRFLKEYPAHVGFGFILTLFSSLGQTFLISLYVPHILADLELTNTTFGTLYAVATIGSSILLMNFGGRIDYRPLSGYIYRTIAILSAATVALGLVQHYLFLPIALLGLRFAGQGLMTHIGQTVLGRHFQENRGKALSLSSLGFSAGEMVFPILIAVLIPIVGWRVSLFVNAAVLLVVVLPMLRVFPLDEFAQPVASDSVSPQASAHWGLLKDTTFWSLAPAIVVLSLTNTGFFFYQLVLAESRGWPSSWYSFVFSGYAAARFAFGLVGGILVDRFGARRLFSLHFIPLVVGLAIVAVVPARWSAVAVLLLAGVSLGTSSPIKAALFAELHGTARLGGVRSVYTAFMVLGTALGPMAFGMLLDTGMGFTPILLGSAGILGLSILPTVRFWFSGSGEIAVDRSAPLSRVVDDSEVEGAAS
ncbi:MAG: MFS transporter [Alkalispirochaeta sp.]